MSWNINATAEKTVYSTLKVYNTLNPQIAIEVVFKLFSIAIQYSYSVQLSLMNCIFTNILLTKSEF